MTLALLYWPSTGAALPTGKLEQVLYGRHLGWPYRTNEAECYKAEAMCTNHE